MSKTALARFIITELGKEKLCFRCREYWPMTKEFFYYTEKAGFHSWCKACYLEWKSQNRPGYGTKRVKSAHEKRASV